MQECYSPNVQECKFETYADPNAMQEYHVIIVVTLSVTNHVRITKLCKPIFSQK